MLIGIDVGTTSVKAILFDGAGTPLESYTQPYETRRGDGGVVEQDADVWVAHIRRALTAFAAAHDLSGVAGIGICSQVNTHVFVDGAGSALAPAIVWQDGRAGDAAAALDEQVSDADRLAWWGAPMPIDASHCLARMKWMADTHPDTWARTRWVMLAKDFCLLKLTGAAVSDPIANVGMVDGGLGYVGPLLDMVPGAAERLPPLAAMHSVAGRMGAGEVCAGVPVAVGTMDAWGGMFGVGAHRPGAAMYLSGTSEVLGINSATVHPTPGVIVFPTVDDITLHAAPTQAGGAAKLWACGLLGVTPDEMYAGGGAAAGRAGAVVFAAPAGGAGAGVGYRGAGNVPRARRRHGAGGSSARGLCGGGTGGAVGTGDARPIGGICAGHAELRGRRVSR